MQDSASRERVSTKALIEENGCSIIEINNAGGDPLSPCPKGAKLENQLRVAALDKGITIVFVLRLDLVSQLSSETASSSGLGIYSHFINFKRLPLLRQ
ncbi:hypothetical protein EKO29_05675 [Colwellia sp. Arc7-635]|uniref:hypothetical protein n=1 Tax=Colwellia sp. Arc7-635 TaxID=2497879 RepID=UPI000F8570DD|nr:hypothetical protein [Colwellia sp. Arc7-635]AZQ83576.1 hypothetical protein EKO29_05675 [Colwellia sp. Arc7-635]